MPYVYSLYLYPVEKDKDYLGARKSLLQDIEMLYFRGKTKPYKLTVGLYPGYGGIPVLRSMVGRSLEVKEKNNLRGDGECQLPQ